MDPNAALANLRQAYNEFVHSDDQELDVQVIIDHARTMAEAVAALDGWLAQGGFLPTPWQIPGVR